MGKGLRVPIGFRLDYRTNQRRIHAVALGGFANQLHDPSRSMSTAGRERPVKVTSPGRYILVCDLVVDAILTGVGLELMKKRRPLSSTILAIWALAGRAQNASAPKIRQAVSVARWFLMARGKSCPSWI